jgi:hypothetical protein
MKNRYFILSILFWAIASVCMAITLPMSSYNSDYATAMSDNESYVSTIGIQVRNYAVLTAYNNQCDHLRPDETSGSDGDIEACKDCCRTNVERGEARQECMLNCSIPLGMPLGTPLLLLPFIAVYALVRKRKESDAEQA